MAITPALKAEQLFPLHAATLNVYQVPEARPLIVGLVLLTVVSVTGPPLYF